MSEQGVQEGTEHTPLRAPWWRVVRRSRIQLQREVLSPRVLSLLISFEGTMVLKSMNSILTYVGVPFVQVGKVSVECNRECIIGGSVRAVCKLE